MKRLILITLLLGTISFAKEIPLNSSKVCQKCHPLIYNEYRGSMHRKASIFNDEVHKAVWDKHPLKKKNKYTCKKCHSPVDTKLRTVPQKNEIQLNEPISCVYCHQIQDIKEHAKANENILTTKKDTLYGARKSKQNEKDVKYEVKSSFFGLITKQEGSPFHHIDFSNKNYYSAKTCMGCHSHKQNSHGLNVCETNFQQKGKANCIECHMPKVPGSFTTLKESKTHRFHGFAGVSHHSEMLAKYVDLKLEKLSNSFQVTIENKAGHELLLHPLRLAQLHVKVYRDGKIIFSDIKSFKRVIGKDKKPAPPWVATEVVENTQIKPYEKRVIEFGFILQKGDQVDIALGFYKVDPAMAKKLGIKEKKNLKFHLLKKLEMEIE